MAFQSTKVLELGSCAFRQPHARHSHCRFIHGYKLSAKFWFEADELDDNNWVFDFGGLKGLKLILKEQFDHTTCIASDDPVLHIFRELVRNDACDLRVMENGTGVERISEWCYNVANEYVEIASSGRVKCIRVEVFEHEDNSAICTGVEESEVEESEVEESEEPVVEKKEKVAAGVTQPPFKVKGDLWPEKQVNTWLDSSGKSTWGF